MHSASRTVIALVVATHALGGCYHYTAAVPGVLDTRSDGSTADASPPAVDDEELRRVGVSAVLQGDGVRPDGAHVVVEERHFFAGITALLPGAFLLSNESPTPELEAALGDGALRELRVSHQASGFDIFLTVVANIIPCVPLVLVPQAYTFVASGERVAAAGKPPVNRPVAPPVEPPPAAPVPPPTSESPESAGDSAEEAAPAPTAPPPATPTPAPAPTPTPAPTPIPPSAPGAAEGGTR